MNTKQASERKENYRNSLTRKQKEYALIEDRINYAKNSVRKEKKGKEPTVNRC